MAQFRNSRPRRPRRLCIPKVKIKRFVTPGVIFVSVIVLVIYFQTFNVTSGIIPKGLRHFLRKDIHVDSLPPFGTHVTIPKWPTTISTRLRSVVSNQSTQSSFIVKVPYSSEILVKQVKTKSPANAPDLAEHTWKLTAKKSKHGTAVFCSATALVGRIMVVTKVNISRLNFDIHSDVKPGGHWIPGPCIPRFKVAIVIPYRDRKNHLYTLLFYLLSVLKRQQVEFRIFVVEQAGRRTFNKGIIMNAGFKEAVRLSDYHCYIFHDVDLIPEDDRNMYTCPGFPRHLSVAVDKFRYHLPYSQLVGGVFAIRREDFETVNGYSNLYWGWGAEDDDMSIRLAVAGMKLVRPSATVARYKMLKHGGRESAPQKWSSYLLKTVKKRFPKDGLSTVNYNVTFMHFEHLFTHIMVDVGEPPKITKNISAIIIR